MSLPLQDIQSALITALTGAVLKDAAAIPVLSVYTNEPYPYVYVGLISLVSAQSGDVLVATATIEAFSDDTGVDEIYSLASQVHTALDKMFRVGSCAVSDREFIGVDTAELDFGENKLVRGASVRFEFSFAPGG